MVRCHLDYRAATIDALMDGVIWTHLLLSGLLTGTTNSPFTFYSRTELHSKFNVLIAKYLHLTNLLNDPHSTLLQSYTVFPNESPANDQQVQNLSVLLRTKLFPELEQEMEDRTKDGDIPGLTASGGSTAEERKILQALKVCWRK